MSPRLRLSEKDLRCERCGNDAVDKVTGAHVCFDVQAWCAFGEAFSDIPCDWTWETDEFGGRPYKRVIGGPAKHYLTFEWRSAIAEPVFPKTAEMPIVHLRVDDLEYLVQFTVRESQVTQIDPEAWSCRVQVEYEVWDD